VKRIRVREIAARIVREVESGEAARTRLDKVEGLDARDRALLTELVYGTVRHRETLEHLLSAVSSRGLDEVDPDAIPVLLVAAYQLVFLDHVAAGVAVSEAVESIRARHVKGFVNGVLRGLGRLVLSRQVDDRAPDAIPSNRRLPGRERGWVILREDVFPDAAKAPREWLELATSHPRGLVARWLERFGFEKTLEVCRAGNAPPPLCVRANVLKTTRDALVTELAGRPGTEAPEAVYLEHKGDPAKLPAFLEGRLTVQDETAMLVAPFAEPRPGARVLDLCSAPGGKSTHLAELMKDEGLVVATDADSKRLDRVRENVARLGLESVKVQETVEGRDFDAVLVDAPCSNTGVLRRRVEVRTRVDELERGALHALQRELLEKALTYLRPGGLLVYATCSIEKEENEDQVAWIVAKGGLATRQERFTLPSRDGGDGGYVASMMWARPGSPGLSSDRG